MSHGGVFTDMTIKRKERLAIRSQRAVRHHARTYKQCQPHKSDVLLYEVSVTWHCIWYWRSVWRDTTSLRLIISYQCSTLACCPHLHMHSSWAMLNMEEERSPETSVTNYESWQRYFRQEFNLDQQGCARFELYRSYALMYVAGIFFVHKHSTCTWQTTQWNGKWDAFRRQQLRSAWWQKHVMSTCDKTWG
jgi:hypothetical protein